MRTPRRSIGAGGWFLRAYAAGFGVVFGIGSALFVGGMFYLVLAGVGTMLMSSDGAIEIDLTGNHTPSHALEPYVAANPTYGPEMPPHAEPLPATYYGDTSPPMPPATSSDPYQAQFDPYQAQAAPNRVRPPAFTQPATSSAYPMSPPYPETPAGSFVPVESPVEASATFEESSQPIFDEPEATPFQSGETSNGKTEEGSVTDDTTEESDSLNSDVDNSNSDDVDSAAETPTLPAA